VLKMNRREAIAGYLFISPWIIGFLVFVLFSIGMAFYVSLTKWDMISDKVWVGFGNYSAMLGESLFWQALKVTLLYAIFSVPLGVAVGFMIALLLNQRLRGLSFWRTVYYLPAVLSGVAVSLMWMWVLNPNFGVINLMLSYIGINGPGWFTDPAWALPSLVLMSLWGAGAGMVIYLAGLQGIPTELYESAQIDGAGPLRKFWNITVPMVSPVLFFNVIMGTIGSFQTFTEAYVVTNGGPKNATLLYSLYLYTNAFKYFKMGYASALAWVLFLIILLLTLLLFWSSKKWVHYTD